MNNHTPKGGEHTPPRIYLASLADYVDGHLHGEWVDADQPVDALNAAAADMLERSPQPNAEEWAIHDYEGFTPVRLNEHESLGTVALLAAGITEHGPPFAHWADAVGANEVGDRDFDSAYLGHYGSVTAYAEHVLTDLGIEAQLDTCIDASLRPYVHVDTEAFARDLDNAGDVVSIDAADGGVYLYDAHA